MPSRSDVLHHTDTSIEARNESANRLLATLTLEQKIGQLVMAGFPGPDANADIARLITERHLGGIIVFARNCASPEQVRGLCQHLQSLSALPLLIAVDQEGGIVARLQDPVTVFPSNMALGATRSIAFAGQAAAMTAHSLSSLGINVNFAPDVDVNSNPLNPVIGVRSFGEDARLVASMGAAAVRGYQDNGLIATAKHFPGHGDTTLDSHLGLPVVTAGMARLESVELPPFVAAIGAGVGMIMTSHVMFPALGAKHPSTLAPEVLTGLLRLRLAYDGLICTDCMEMQAITDTYSTHEAAALAIEAGADLVLVSHRTDRQTAALDGLLSAARSGRLSLERIDASVLRILHAKARLAKPREAALAFPILEQEQAARHMAQAATTLLKNDGKLLPLKPGVAKQVALVEFVLQRPTQVEDDLPRPSLLAQLLSEKLPRLRVLTVPALAAAQQARQISELAASSELVIYATRNASLNPEQANTVRAALQTGTPGVILALRAPYDLTQFAQAAVHLATYGDPPCSIRAAIDVLFGVAHPAGRLPVTLPGMYAAGEGKHEY